MCRVSARRLSIYNFVWRLLKATKKVYLKYPKSEKNKDTYGIFLTKFASSTQKHKKVLKTQNQPIEIKKIKNEKKAKIRMGATRRSLQAQPKILKKLSEIFGNFTIYTNIFPKKYAHYL
jgi:hypothetical protein